MVGDGASTHKMDYLKKKDILNLEGHHNRTTGSRVKAILLKGGILPIGGVASEMVCACSLRSRLDFNSCGILCKILRFKTFQYKVNIVFPVLTEIEDKLNI